MAISIVSSGRNQLKSTATEFPLLTVARANLAENDVLVCCLATELVPDGEIYWKDAAGAYTVSGLSVVTSGDFVINNSRNVVATVSLKKCGSLPSGTGDIIFGWVFSNPWSLRAQWPSR